MSSYILQAQIVILVDASYSWEPVHKTLWRNRPMRALLKFRNIKERDCATVAQRCRVLPPLPSPLFAPHRALLAHAINTGSRNNKSHVTPMTSRATIHNAAFSACQTPAFIRVTAEKSTSLVRASMKLEEKCMQWISYEVNNSGRRIQELSRWRINAVWLQ
jgi:hypothetical protein